MADSPHRPGRADSPGHPGSPGSPGREAELDVFFELSEEERPKLIRRLVFARAMDLLARREHTRKQLGTKLAQREFDGEQADPDLLAEVLDRLEQEGLLDEARFAESYVRAKARKGYGPERIRMELKDQGVSGEAATDALRCGDDSIDYDWFELARAAKLKKYGEASPGSATERAKWQRFLRYRGFDFEQIDYALESSAVR